jgi:hypothetical protein
MKPGKNDKRTSILIQGDELHAIQHICYVFTECFGLDSRIASYKGKRPLGLYQWDCEYLIAGIDYVVNNEKGRQSVSRSDLAVLRDLLERICETCKEAYG